MKLIQMKCPSCGADFEISEDRKACFCSYCGNHVIIDDEVKKTKHEFVLKNETKIRQKEIEAEMEKARWEASKWTPAEKRTRSILWVIDLIAFVVAVYTLLRIIIDVFLIAAPIAICLFGYLCITALFKKK